MNQLTFPPYLGFGLLKNESIRTENNFQIAGYYLLEKKVMEIRVSGERVYIQDFFEEKSLTFTCHRTLKDALMHHFLCRETKDDPIYNYLIKKVCALGNIFFEYPTESKQKVVYYPAAYLLLIRIIITHENRHICSQLKEDKNMQHFVQKLYPATLTSILNNGTEQEEGLCVLELTVPVAFVYNLMKALVNYKLILPQKKYRAIIQTIEKINVIAQIFLGAKTDDWVSYAIKYISNK